MINVFCRRLFNRKATAAKNTSLGRQLSLSPPPPSTPPPDFSQCVMGSTHFLPIAFPNHHLAHQQNSENLATEKHKIAAAVEEATLLQMGCYSQGWQKSGQIPKDAYLRNDKNCFSAGSRETSGPHIQNGGSDRLLLCPGGALSQKDKRRFSKTSGASSRTRADDLSV